MTRNDLVLQANTQPPEILVLILGLERAFYIRQRRPTVVEHQKQTVLVNSYCVRASNGHSSYTSFRLVLSFLAPKCAFVSLLSFRAYFPCHATCAVSYKQAKESLWSEPSLSLPGHTSQAEACLESSRLYFLRQGHQRLGIVYK